MKNKQESLTKLIYQYLKYQLEEKNNTTIEVEGLAKFLTDKGICVPECFVGDTIFVPSVDYKEIYAEKITGNICFIKNICASSLVFGEERLGKTAFKDPEEIRKVQAEKGIKPSTFIHC